jgi:hypothetical protein
MAKPLPMAARYTKTWYFSRVCRVNKWSAYWSCAAQRGGDKLRSPSDDRRRKDTASSRRVVRGTPVLVAGCASFIALLGGPQSATVPGMTLKARVHAGRLVVDEPTDLPEGTEVELLPLDPGDWLDEADRAALHRALRESDADIAAGRLVDAEEILKELRSS